MFYTILAFAVKIQNSKCCLTHKQYRSLQWLLTSFSEGGEGWVGEWGGWGVGGAVLKILWRLSTTKCTLWSNYFIAGSSGCKRLWFLLFLKIIRCFSMLEESTTMWVEDGDCWFGFQAWDLGLGLAVYAHGHFPVCLECLIERQTAGDTDSPLPPVQTRLRNNPVGSCRIFFFFCP